MGKGSNSTTQNQTSTTSVDPAAYAAYQGLISQAQQTAATPWNPNTAQQVAGFSGDQNAAFNAIRGGISQPYINQAAQFATTGASPISGAQISNYQNPWTDQVVNATQADFDRQNQRGISAVTGNARLAGSLGGDREQVAKALTAREQTSAQSPIIANLRSQGYNTALGAAQQDAGRSLQGAGIMGQLGQLAYTDVNAQLGIGGMQQQNQQQQYDAASGNAAAQSAYPFQTQQWLASILGSATPNMGSTTTSTGTKQGPTPNTWSQLGGAALAALPYLNTGGRISYASGGGIGYVPQFQPQGGGGIQAAPMMQMGGDTKQKGLADHLKEIQDSAKGYSDAAKGVNGAANKVGEWMRTENNPSVPGGGGTTTTTYADPMQNASYGISNTFGGLGEGISSFLSGFAAGGAIDDSDPGGLYDAPISMSDAVPVNGGILPRPYAMPGSEDIVRPPLMRQAMDAPRQPMQDAPPLRDVESVNVPTSSVGAPPTAGDPYAPPPLDVLNPRVGGIGAMPQPSSPPRAASAPPAEGGIGGLWDRFNNWRTSGEGTAFLTNMGAAMMAGSGVGGKGSFGIHAGQGLQSGLKAQDSFRQGEREKLIEDGKMKLAQRAAQLRDDEAGREAAMVPYKQRLMTAQATAQEAAAKNKEDPSAEYRIREREADAQGLTGDARKYFILNKKLPEDKQLTSTELKAIDDSVKAISAEDRVIRQLERARELSKNAASGFGAQGEAGLWAGLGLDGARSQNTLELGNILSREAILDMSNTLKGASTDREMSEFQKLSGAATTSATVRDKLIENALAEARTAKAVAERRAEQIRGKSFFKPGGMTTVAPQGATLPTPKDKSELDRLPSGTRFIDPEGKERVKP